MKCNHEWERLTKISEMDIPLGEPCPSCSESGAIERRIYHAPSFGDVCRLGMKKTDEGFKSVLQSIHAKTPGSTLDQTSVLTRI